MLARGIAGLRPGFVLAQNRYDLTLSKPDPHHHPSLQQGPDSKFL
jgi:hypothetical protein